MVDEGKALRVLMVTPRYFPDMGGIETHVHEVGCRLVRQGVDVTLLTTVPHTSYIGITTPPREEVVEGMRVMRVQDWVPRKDYCIAPEMYAIITQGRWDLLHCQGCHTFVPPTAMLAARAAKIPYIVTFHTGGHSSRLRDSIRGIQWQLLRPLLIHATKLIGVSRFEADYFRNLLHLPVRRFSVIPNGGTALPGIEQPPVQPSSQSLIISVGRLERYKGHQHMIAAMPRIREVRPDARLLILGAGPYEARLRELARKVGVTEYVEIRSVPAHDRQAMAEFLSQAALVVLLSEYEAHPVAVMEAISLRQSVLVTDTSGLSELAEQGLVRAIPLRSTPEEVARAALQQLEDPFVPPSQVVLPTWDECARQIESVYHTSLGRE